MISAQNLRQEAEGISGKLRDLYRIIHQNPELGRQELETSVLVERRLLEELPLGPLLELVFWDYWGRMPQQKV